MEHKTERRLIDERVLRHKVGGTKPISASTLSRLIERGVIPAGIKIGPKTIRWYEDTIDARIDEIAAAHEKAGRTSATPLRLGWD